MRSVRGTCVGVAIYILCICRLACVAPGLLRRIEPLVTSIKVWSVSIGPAIDEILFGIAMWHSVVSHWGWIVFVERCCSLKGCLDRVAVSLVHIVCFVAHLV